MQNIEDFILRGRNSYLDTRNRQLKTAQTFPKLEAYLLHACIVGNFNFVRMIIVSGKVDPFFTGDELPLLYACFNEHYKIVEYLLSIGANVDDSNAMMSCRSKSMLDLCRKYSRNELTRITNGYGPSRFTSFQPKYSKM